MCSCRGGPRESCQNAASETHAGTRFVHSGNFGTFWSRIEPRLYMENVCHVTDIGIHDYDDLPRRNYSNLHLSPEHVFLPTDLFQSLHFSHYFPLHPIHIPLHFINQSRHSRRQNPNSQQSRISAVIDRNSRYGYSTLFQSRVTKVLLKKCDDITGIWTILYNESTPSTPPLPCTRTGTPMTGNGVTAA